MKVPKRYRESPCTQHPHKLDERPENVCHIVLSLPLTKNSGISKDILVHKPARSLRELADPQNIAQFADKTRSELAS